MYPEKSTLDPWGNCRPFLLLFKSSARPEQPRERERGKGDKAGEEKAGAGAGAGGHVSECGGVVVVVPSSHERARVNLRMEE